MTAPNLARDAQPGRSFTDARRGTWVLLAPGSGKLGWWFTSADGAVHGWRTQKEAEAAGLVPLYSFPEFESIGWVRAEVAALGPLDPGNPEHRAWAYRQAAMALDPELYAGAIDDLQRWASEAEDRACAEEYARAEAAGEDRAVGGWDAMRADVREWHIALALRVIRAERARAESVP